MKLRQEYLIAYDIEDNKTRTRLYKQLLAYGLNAVQKSVFWGCLTVAELNAIKRMFNKNLATFDKAFITRTNMQNQPLDFMFGYQKNSFKDWNEYDCI